MLFIQVLPREQPKWGFSAHQSQYEKAFLFETDIEACDIEIPPMAYYEVAFATAAARRSYRISRSVDRRQLIKELIDYRGMFFQSVIDIDRLIGKAIHKKDGTSKTLTTADFRRVISAPKKTSRANSGRVTAEQELDRMIGMADVKQQLKRAIRRMELNKRRRDNGYKTSDAHLAACFLGSPGTSKTTTARIFGRMLCETNVLVSDAFVEVSRKDLVGQYVGWTAPLVARVFEQAKGGTLFIDEAYSLMSEGMKDGYSAEALSEIVRQMENNPDTLVIFAGYPDKMRAFIQQANPGLRSRLTNLIEFKDYDAQEMWAIFRHFVESEQYVLGDAGQAERAVRSFLAEIGRLTKGDTGNGRLMRKLFQTAVGFMAERDDHDLRTIEAVDIEHAVRELLSQEAFLGADRDKPRRIGFA